MNGSFFRTTIAFILGAGALLIAGGGPDFAADDPEVKAWRLCRTTGDASPIQQRAEQCTIAIRGARNTGDSTGEVEMLTHRCWVYIYLEQIDLAQEDCDAALKLERKYEQKFGTVTGKTRVHDVYAVRGALHYAKGEYNEALEDENQAIDTIDSPESEFAYIFSNRGLTLSALHDADGALANWNQAIRLDKQYMPAYLQRGLEYERRGEIEKAKNDFIKVLALPAQDYDFGHEKHEKAQSHLNKILERAQ